MTMCEYCEEDSGGFVRPLDKNGHASLRKSSIYGWVIDMAAKGWSGHATIYFCPKCWKRLRSETEVRE